MPHFYAEEGHPTDQLGGIEWDPADGPFWVDVRVGVVPVELKVVMDGVVVLHAECSPGWTERFSPRSKLILRAFDATQVSYRLSTDDYWSPVGEEPHQPHSVAINL